MNRALKSLNGRRLGRGSNPFETVIVYRVCLKCVSSETRLPGTDMSGVWTAGGYVREENPLLVILSRASER